MKPQEKNRFNFLQNGPCIPPDYNADYYGLPWPLPNDVRSDFEAWQSQQRKPAKCDAGTHSRYALESFMQQKGLLPKKWMAVRLGMSITSLEDLLEKLKDIGMQRKRYEVYEDLIAQSLSEDLLPNLPNLKFRTFSDHNAFCERLHAELGTKLGINVEPQFCATSKIMQDNPRQFANEFDCITLDPLSSKHQIWLNFSKPLHLGPDRCSKLFYVQNHKVLSIFCAGTYEPDDLDAYRRFLKRPANAGH